MSVNEAVIRGRIEGTPISGFTANGYSWSEFSVSTGSGSFLVKAYGNAAREVGLHGGGDVSVSGRLVSRDRSQYVHADSVNFAPSAARGADVFLEGKMRREPAMSITDSGYKRAVFSVVSEFGYTDSNGGRQSEQSSFVVEAFGKAAEFIEAAGREGTDVKIEGALKMNRKGMSVVAKFIHVGRGRDGFARVVDVDKKRKRSRNDSYGLER